MRLQDHIDFTTLQWVKPELDETLSIAREALESYVEQPGNLDAMRSCIDHLHQVRGTLQMVELYGAAMVTAEMETLANALLDGQVTYREEAYAALMRGLMQLPDYLERLSGGHRDVPVVLLPLLNDLRSSREQPPLTEAAMFHPNLDAFLPTGSPAAISETFAEEHRGELAGLRLRFQQQLLSWFRGQQADQQLVGMRETLLAIAGRCFHVHGRRLWWIAAGMLEGLEQGMLKSQAGEIRQLIGKVDRNIRQLIEHGENSLRGSESDDLARNMLYIVAQATQRSEQMDLLRSTYSLDSLLPNASELEHARGSMTGHNRALLDSVSRALKDDLLRVKEALDLFLRQQDGDPEQLAAQSEVLERVGDTLGMLALNVPRRVVIEQRRVLDEISSGQRQPDEETLLDVAGALLYVESSLDDHIESLGSEDGSADAGMATQGLPRSEALGVVTALMHEAITNTGHVKGAIVAFVESGWEHSHLAVAPTLMGEVAGALRMLSAPRPGDLAEGVGRFVADELLTDRRVPSGVQMDHLADALAALEYYLEAAREHRGGLEHILDVAEHSLGLLGYWPLPQLRPIVVKAVARPVAAEAQVAEEDLPREAHPDLSESVSMAAGDDLGQLFIGETEAYGAPAHDVDGLRLVETEATAPVIQDASSSTSQEDEWVEIEEEEFEEVPVRDALSANTRFNLNAEGIDDDIREIFLEEMQEEIDSLGSGEKVWLSNPGQLSSLITLRRSFHTLKGSGRLVGAGVLGEFAWKVEEMLNRVLDATIEPHESVQGVVRHAIKALPGLLLALKGEGTPTAPLGAIMQTAEEVAAGLHSRVEDHLTNATETIRRVVRRRIPRSQLAVDAVPAASITEAGTHPADPSTNAFEPSLPMPVMPPVDPVLLEILRSEVAQYLQTIRADIQRSDIELPIGEALLRAVHTLHGAIAMVDIPLLTQMLSPLESLFKRLRALNIALSSYGVRLLTQTVDMVDDVMGQFDAVDPRLPNSDELTAQISAMRDRYPESQVAHVIYQPLPGEMDATDELGAGSAETGEFEDNPFASGHTEFADTDAAQVDSLQGSLDAPSGNENAAPAQHASLVDAVDATADSAGHKGSDALAAEMFAALGAFELEVAETERATAASLATEQAAAARAAADHAAAEQLAMDQAAAVQALADHAAAEQAAIEQAAMEQASLQRAAAEKIAAELAQAEQEASSRRAAEEAARAVEAQAAAEAAERVVVARQLAEKAAADQLVAEQAENQRAAEAFAAELAAAQHAAETLAAEQAAARRLAEQAARTLAVEQAAAQHVVDTLAAEQAAAQRVAEQAASALAAEQAAAQRAAEQAALASAAEHAAMQHAAAQAASALAAEQAAAQRAAEEAALALAVEQAAARHAAEQAALVLAAEQSAARQVAEQAALALAAEQAAAQLAAEQAATQLAADQAAERVAAAQLAVEKAALETAAAAKAAEDEAAAARAILAKEALEKRAAEHADRMAAEQLAAERLAAQKALADKQAAAAAQVFPLASAAGQRPGDDQPGPAPIDADLLEMFIDEAREILDHTDGVLAQWHASPTQLSHVAELQRDLHTLKGGARIAGQLGVGDLTHAVETLLEKPIRDAADTGNVIAVLEASFHLLHQQVQLVSLGQVVDYPKAMIDQLLALAGETDLTDDDTSIADAALYSRTASAAMMVPVTAAPITHSAFELANLPDLLPEMEEEVRSSQEQIRVRADLLDSLVNHAGEVAIYRSRLEQQVAGYRFNLVELEQTVSRLRSQLRMLEIETEAQIIARFQREHREAGITVFDPLELDRYSQLQQYSRALAESVSDLVSIQSTLDELTRQAETLLIQQSRVSTELQEGLLRTRMLPFDTMVPNLRRTLRQATQDEGKSAQLYVDGAHGEMDRNLLDRIKAPFEHMLRNAIAHGIESPEERRAAGKPVEGSVHIRVAREATEVIIRVSDDGRGLDRDAIRARGIERGLLRADTRPTDNQLLSLITQPGFSTASKVTQLAGRGVGMDVVANEIKQLGGSLSIESVAGNGSVFVMRLPFTLAVTQAILVRIGEATFAIPMTSVQGVARVNPEDLAGWLSEAEPTFKYGNEEYGIHDLAELLGLPPGLPAEGEQQPLLLTRAGDLRAAIRIDAVLGSREIVVKSVGPQISSVPGLLGATIMGDGSVLVILDLAPLVRHGITRRQHRLADGLSAVEAPVIEEVRVRPLVMVVDDSITMRKVTSRVLERHEYEVSTAKDGIDAMEKLHERVPDLMLLDIEMPRMDGYELATHMKADPRWRDVPIIMITSRSGDKHRQRAFDIGVDRYLGKPYQEADLLVQITEVLEQRVGVAP